MFEKSLQSKFCSFNSHQQLNPKFNKKKYLNNNFSRQTNRTVAKATSTLSDFSLLHVMFPTFDAVSCEGRRMPEALGASGNFLRSGHASRSLMVAQWSLCTLVTRRPQDL